MKFRKGLFLAWVIPQVLLLFLNLSVLTFILVYNKELKEINRDGIWTIIWEIFSLVWIFGTVRIMQWLKQGKFHVATTAPSGTIELNPTTNKEVHDENREINPR